MLDALHDGFRNRFHSKPEQVFFCPGRVNLIGEHIDYNGGAVMPFAVNRGVFLAVARTTDKMLHFHALNFPATAAFHVQSSYSKTGGEWFNYPLGVIDHFIQEEKTISGLHLLFAGNLPIGAGLSSSAAIELVTAYALNQLFGWEQDRVSLAQQCQQVENSFIGVSCGIMDQFAVAMGKKNKALLLNCDSLEYEYLPLQLPGYSIVIIDTHKQRQLTDSKYNERFAECGRALKLLKRELDIPHLCAMTMAQFSQYQSLLQDPILEKRVRHVVSENARVQDAVIALQTGDIAVLGKLLYNSHESLRKDYEVTGPELDTVIDFCREFSDCAGARMTGAGFGGCAIAIVKDQALPEFGSRLSPYFQNIIGHAPGIFITHAEDGVHQL